MVQSSNLFMGRLLVCLHVTLGCADLLVLLTLSFML